MNASKISCYFSQLSPHLANDSSPTPTRRAHGISRNRWVHTGKQTYFCHLVYIDIRHFVLTRFSYGFIICDLENPPDSNFHDICHICNMCPPYWIRHFVFTHFAYVFVISDIGNPRVPIFWQIKCFEVLSTFFQLTGLQQEPGGSTFGRKRVRQSIVSCY